MAPSLTEDQTPTEEEMKDAEMHHVNTIKCQLCVLDDFWVGGRYEDISLCHRHSQANLCPGAEHKGLNLLPHSGS